MPEDWSNLIQAIVAVLTVGNLYITFLLTYKLVKRQTDAATTQTKTTLLQTLNTHDFAIHQFFIDNPAIRPYFYGEPADKPLEALTLEERQKVRAAAGYMLDFFHLIIEMEERFPAEVHNGYLEFLKDSFQKSEILRTYMDDHTEWTGWYNKLAPYRPDLRRRPDGTFVPAGAADTKVAAATVAAVENEAGQSIATARAR